MFKFGPRYLTVATLLSTVWGQIAVAQESALYYETDSKHQISLAGCNAPRCRGHQSTRRGCSSGCCKPSYSQPYDADSGAQSDLAPNLPEPGDEIVPETAPTAPDYGDLASNYGVPRGPQSFAPGMLGDFLTGGSLSGPIVFVGPGFNPRPPFNGTPPGPTPGEPAIPGRFELDAKSASPYAFHTFKIADNESPWPRSRVYFTSNYFSHVGDSTAITRQMLGFERAVLEGRGSVGMRLPFYTADPAALSSPTFDGGTIGSFGADTGAQGNIGDLSIILKYALMIDRQGGNVLSTGLAITAPTGPATIGGVEPLYVVNGVKHRGTIQPYLALYHSLGGGFNGLFIHGFSAIDAPFDAQDATYWYNDLGLGYMIQRSRRRGLTAIIPTFEAHVNTPISNTTHSVSASPLLRDLTFQPGLQMDPLLNTALGELRYHNQVNLTSGVTFVFNRRSTVALGVVAPVGGPNPYNYELQAQVNFFRAPWQPGGMLGR